MRPGFKQNEVRWTGRRRSQWTLLFHFYLSQFLWGNHREYSLRKTILKINGHVCSTWPTALGHRTQEWVEGRDSAVMRGGGVKRHFMNQWTFLWSKGIWKLAAKDIPFIWVEGTHLSKMMWHAPVIFKWFPAIDFTNYHIAFRFLHLISIFFHSALRPEVGGWHFSFFSSMWLYPRSLFHLGAGQTRDRVAGKFQISREAHFCSTYF